MQKRGDNPCGCGCFTRPLDQLAAMVEEAERKANEEFGSVLAMVNRQVTFLDGPPLVNEAEREQREKKAG